MEYIRITKEYKKRADFIYNYLHGNGILKP